jgi:hypothetical protein
MTNNNPVYVLQRDLPNVKAGTEFKKVSALAYASIESGKWHVEYCNEIIENNPEWFKKKEEPIKERVEVSTFHKVAREPEHEDYLYAFYTNKKFDKELFPAIKQAIEAVLNPSQREIVDKEKDLFSWIKVLKELVVKSERFEIAHSIRTIEKWLNEPNEDEQTNNTDTQVEEIKTDWKGIARQARDYTMVEEAADYLKGQFNVLNLLRPTPEKDTQVESKVPEAKSYANTHEAYNSGYAAGVSFQKKYGESEKTYTERELLEAESKAFYASREKRIYDTVPFCHTYPTFSDYKDSLKP